MLKYENTIAALKEMVYRSRIQGKKTYLREINEVEFALISRKYVSIPQRV